MEENDEFSNFRPDQHKNKKNTHTLRSKSKTTHQSSENVRSSISSFKYFTSKLPVLTSFLITCTNSKTLWPSSSSTTIASTVSDYSVSTFHTEQLSSPLSLAGGLQLQSLTISHLGSISWNEFSYPIDYETQTSENIIFAGLLYNDAPTSEFSVKISSLDAFDVDQIKSDTEIDADLYDGVIVDYKKDGNKFQLGVVFTSDQSNVWVVLNIESYDPDFTSYSGVEGIVPNQNCKYNFVLDTDLTQILEISAGISCNSEFKTECGNEIPAGYTGKLEPIFTTGSSLSDAGNYGRFSYKHSCLPGQVSTTDTEELLQCSYSAKK